MSLPWHLYVMALLYILAGLNHFRKPHIYRRIIPPYFPNPKLLNVISGGAEVLLGIGLCIPDISKYAAIGIIGLLVAIFPANLFMYTNQDAGLGVPKRLLLLRLPLQVFLILWAYFYTGFIQ